VTRTPLAFEPLLAAWRDLGNHFSGRHAQFKLADALTLGAIVIAGAALIALMLWWQKRLLRRERSNQPLHLFQDLCHAHSLSWWQRRLIERLAQQRDITPRASLFVRPDLFAPQELPDALQSYRHAYAELRERLFADLHEPDVVPESLVPMPTPGPAPVPLQLPTTVYRGGFPIGNP
jgi:hypothetical protein